MQQEKSKNIEVEIRAHLDNIAEFKEILDRMGAQQASSLYICDVYFCVETATRVEDVEMDEVGSYSIRLRKSKKDGENEHITINTKTIINHGDHNAWEEHEIKVNDFSEAAKILNTTEFKPFFMLEKTRFTYRLDDMEICVEDITDFGGAVEIEIMISRGQEDNAKRKIRAFLMRCGVSEKKIVPKSITNIIMKERAFKQKIDI